MNKLTTRTTLLATLLIILTGTLTGCNTMQLKKATIGFQYSSTLTRTIILPLRSRPTTEVIIPSRPVQIIPQTIYRGYIY